MVARSVSVNRQTSIWASTSSPGPGPLDSTEQCRSHGHQALAPRTRRSGLGALAQHNRYQRGLTKQEQLVEGRLRMAIGNT